jgi:hypothetical protein
MGHPPGFQRVSQLFDKRLLTGLGCKRPEFTTKALFDVVEETASVIRLECAQLSWGQYNFVTLSATFECNSDAEAIIVRRFGSLLKNIEVYGGSKQSHSGFEILPKIIGVVLSCAHVIDNFSRVTVIELGCIERSEIASLQNQRASPRVAFRRNEKANHPVVPMIAFALSAMGVFHCFINVNNQLMELGVRGFWRGSQREFDEVFIACIANSLEYRCTAGGLSTKRAEFGDSASHPRSYGQS